MGVALCYGYIVVSHQFTDLIDIRAVFEHPGAKCVTKDVPSPLYAQLLEQGHKGGSRRTAVGLTVMLDHYRPRLPLPLC